MMKNKHEIKNQYFSDEMVDEIECENINSEIEMIDEYFNCSEDYWKCLTPEIKADLVERHPHILNHFPEE